MKKLNLLLAAATLAAPFLTATGASAQTVYTDRAAFLAAISNANTTTFNNVTSDIAVGSGNTVQGFTFTGSTQNQSLIDASPFNNNSLGGLDGSTFFGLNGLVNNATFTIGLATAANAFGFDTFNFDLDNDRAEVFVGGQSLGLTPSTRGQTGFLGFVAAPGATFSSLSIVGRGSGNAYNGFDNFTVGSAITAAVPEPATWGMMMLGMGMVGGTLRRRRASSRALRFA